MKKVPPIEQIFEDLDAYRDFCRFEGHVFDEKDLYRHESDIWQAYQRSISNNKRKKKFK